MPVLLLKMSLAPGNCCHVGLLECSVLISYFFKRNQRPCGIFFYEMSKFLRYSGCQTNPIWEQDSFLLNFKMFYILLIVL